MHCTAFHVCSVMSNSLNPRDCSPSDFSLHGIPLARILEGDATSYSRGSSWPRDQKCISCIFCIGKWILYSRTWLSHFTFTFHFYALEKEMATHSSVLAWRTPGMGLHRVGHDWSDLAVAVAPTMELLSLYTAAVACWEKTKQNPGPRRKVFEIERNQPKNRGTFAASAMPSSPRGREAWKLHRLGEQNLLMQSSSIRGQVSRWFLHKMLQYLESLTIFSISQGTGSWMD